MPTFLELWKAAKNKVDTGLTMVPKKGKTADFLKAESVAKKIKVVDELIADLDKAGAKKDVKKFVDFELKLDKAILDYRKVGTDFAKVIDPDKEVPVKEKTALGMALKSSSATLIDVKGMIRATRQELENPGPRAVKEMIPPKVFSLAAAHKLDYDKLLKFIVDPTGDTSMVDDTTKLPGLKAHQTIAKTSLTNLLKVVKDFQKFESQKASMDDAGKELRQFFDMAESYLNKISIALTEWHQGHVMLLNKAKKGIDPQRFRDVHELELQAADDQKALVQLRETMKKLFPKHL